MEYQFDDWKKALEDFKSSVAKDLEEIRQHKEEIRQVKEQIYSARNAGAFYRDEKRIVISAPEIVIGNVDRDGTLREGGALVVLRGRQVNLDGVGASGQVQTRAASIRHLAVDSGIDGQEAVVGAISEVVSQAGQISLDAQLTQGVFSQSTHSAGWGGVSIHADGQLRVDASVSSEEQKNRLEALLQNLQDQKSRAEQEVSDGIKSFEAVATSIKGIYDHQDDVLSDVMSVRTSVGELNDIEQQVEGLSAALYSSYDRCASALSALAEINRQISCLKQEKSQLKSGDEYKKKPTGSSVCISSERVDVISQDGDGNLRDNDGSGVGIVARDVQVKSVDAKGALQKEGKVQVNAMKVEISTQNTKDEKYENQELQSGEYPAEGDFVVKSKNITLEALDEEFKDKKLQEKALTKEGKVAIRAEKMDMSATDTEGKATGSLALNAKEVSVRSMDVEKEKRTDDKLSAGSSMVLVSEKMFLGAKSKDVKSKLLQGAGEEIGLFADKTLEAQQEKAVLQLTGGKTALSGSENHIYGKDTLYGETEIKAELKTPKATVDNLEAKTSFKSQNISDGIGVPVPAAPASFSAKLKAEDAPKEE